MPDDQVIQLVQNTPGKDQLRLVKSLRSKGQISERIYQTLLYALEKDRQWESQVGPRREADLLAAAQSVAPDPSKKADKQTREAAKELAYTPLEKWDEAIRQLEGSKTIGPLVARAWRISFFSYYQQEMERHNEGIRDARRIAAENARLKRELDAEVARARSGERDSLEVVERKLNILALFRYLSSDPEPRRRLPQQQSVTITPAGGGSFYATDPNNPGGTRYYQRRGNTFYFTE